MTASALTAEAVKPAVRTGQRLAAVCAGVFGVLVIWVLADPLLGHQLTVRGTSSGEEQKLGGGLLLSVALLVSLTGWASLAVLERFLRGETARRIWVAVAVAVLLLSFLPFAAHDMAAGTAVALTATHLVLGAVLIPGMTSPAAFAAAGRSRPSGADR